MKIKLQTVFAGLLYCSMVLAQKPVIDSGVFGKWPELQSSVQVSKNGKYFSFIVSNYPEGASSVIVQSVAGTWKKQFFAGTPGCFMGEGSTYVLLVKDSLLFITPGTDSVRVVSNVSSFQVCNQWIAYRLNNPEKDLILENSLTAAERVFRNILDYDFNKTTSLLLLQTVGAWEIFDVGKSQSTTIWSGDSTRLLSHAFDISGTQLCFLTESGKGDAAQIAVWYYKIGRNEAVKLADNTSVENGLSISNRLLSFSPNGRYIFLTLEQATPRRVLNHSYPKLDVWSYKDSVLQSEQLCSKLNWSGKQLFTAVIGPGRDRKLIRLEYPDEKMLTTINNTTGDFVVIEDHVSIREPWWALSVRPSAWLVSLLDGSRKLLTNNLGFSDRYYSFAPSGKYIVYYNGKKNAYFSYNTATGKIRNISTGVTTQWNTVRDRLVSPIPVGLGGWLGNDENVLVYDNYDIWQLSLDGLRRPVNLTAGYGRKNGIKLRLLNKCDFYVQSCSYEPDEALLLTAFNTVTKQNGFYRLSLSPIRRLDCLSMDNVIQYQVVNIWAKNGMLPVKAANSNTWIVMRETASDYPNLYATEDLRSFRRLTNFQPEKKYNWLTSELIAFRLVDGRSINAILYKPENFDPGKKYPVVFQYYEDESFRLHSFPMPEFSNTAEINIPFYVSNGYVVCVPDIPFSLATQSNKTTGENARDAVVGAATYLSKMPWVDPGKMAINGHSTGGGETNFLITHSHLFCAAVEGAGVSDNVSDYGSLSGGGEPRQFREESMGATLWQRPDLYVRNSAVFKLDKVSAPILMMHNRSDGSVPWTQGIEFFTGLRRLGKPVWMLQYDEDGHGIRPGIDQLDFNIRLKQFLDHYLKGAPAPVWMTLGISARLKQIEAGYELDPSGNCGKACKVCRHWNERMRIDPVATMKEVRTWEHL